MRETESSPFACPNCGTNDAWRAEYPEWAYQGCYVEVGDDGGPEIIDYSGAYGHFDDASQENDTLRCGNCEHEITLGEWTFTPAGPQTPESLAAKARELHTLLQDAIETLKTGDELDDESGPHYDAVTDLQHGFEHIDSLLGAIGYKPES